MLKYRFLLSRKVWTFKAVSSGPTEEGELDAHLLKNFLLSIENSREGAYDCMREDFIIIGF